MSKESAERICEESTRTSQCGLNLQFDVTCRPCQEEGFGHLKEFGIRFIDENNGDVRIIEGISPEKQTVENFIELCIRFSVSAVHVQDVLEDYLAEC